jgi:predicted  nucleic acid-binding Zn-ribbon protein
MNIEEQMLTLGKLARADLRLKELTAILKEGPRELGEHRSALETAQATLEETKQQRKAAEEGRAEAEKELVTTERRLTQSQANAKRIATESQHEASQIEIAALQRRRDEWEEQVLVRMTRAEELESKIPGMKKTVKKTETAFGKVEGSVPALVDSAKREAVALLRARDQILGTLDAPVRRLYQTAASRPGNPLTTVLDKICQTCHTRVPPQHLVETLQSRAVHICPNCKKIVGKVMHSDDE